MKNVLYVMNVEWNWIKQRPHFIAERLSKVFNVHIVYQYKYGRKGLQQRNDIGLNITPIKVIPKITGIENLRWINDSIIAWRIKQIIKAESPECLFLTYPTQVKIIPSNYRGEVYYDCMDNHSAFISDKYEKEKLEICEREIVERAKRVFVSSDYLKRVIIKRYQIDEQKLLLVRNAYDGQIIDSEKQNTFGSVMKLAYIGTISSWFDFDLIMDVLKNKKNVEFHLYGPIDKVSIPSNSRILYHGVIEHAKLYDAIKDMDCLIMPFVLNDIIEAVDPVKVYEYVNFNKNIIIREYPEIERFKDFVYFYNSPKEFLDVLCEIENRNNVKYDNDQRVDFLKENTWGKRTETIIDIMKK